MRWVAAGQLLRTSTFAVLIVLCVRGDADIQRVAWAEVAAVAAMAAWYVFGQQRSIGAPQFASDLARLRSLALAALPVGMSRGLATVQSYAPTLLVAHLSGAIAVAWFAAANRLVSSLSSFVEIHLFNLYPQLVQALGAGEGHVRELLAPSLRASAWLGVGAALAATELAPEIAQGVYGAQYAAAAPALALAIWTLPLALLGGHARVVLLAAGAQRSELAANSAGAVVTITVGVAVVPHFGASGAAAMLVAGAAATCVAAHAMARRRVALLPVAPALRAFGAAAFAAGLPRVLSIESALPRAVVVGVGYLALAIALEPALLRDLARLRSRASR